MQAGVDTLALLMCNGFRQCPNRLSSELAQSSHLASRSVERAQLHALTSLPMINRERPGYMDRCLAIAAQQKITQWRAGSPKGDRLEAGAVIRCQREAHMPALSNDLGEADAMCREGEYGLGIARAKRTGPFDLVHKLWGWPTHGHRPVDQ